MSLIKKRVRWHQGYRAPSWRVDETYVKVGGKWKYLFRAVDKHGRLIDFMLTDRRNTVLRKSIEGYVPLAAVLDYDRPARLLPEGYRSLAAGGQAVC